MLVSRAKSLLGRRQTRMGRSLERWQRKPSSWVRDNIHIQSAKLRTEKQLRAWLETQPIDSHLWCRRQLAAGKLRLDGACYQTELLDSMAQPGWYALRCANGVGKTSTAALLVLWFLDVWPPEGPGGTKVVTTAGTYGQLKEQLWREIHTWAAEAKRSCAWAGRLDKAQIDIQPNWVALARAADRSETFEGVHADHVLIVVDEAKAVPSQLYGAFRRILRGGGTGGKYWFVFMSSPGSPMGTFWELTEGGLAHRVTTFGLSAYESSRVSLDTIAEDAQDLGEDSPLFVSMDLGQFPEEGEDSLVALSWVLAAQGRQVEVAREPRVLGVDVARFGGHETIGMELAGRRAAIVFAHTGQDLMQTVGKILEAHQRHNYQAVAVDDTGVGGGVTDALRHSEEMRQVRLLPVNFGGKSDHPDRYVNVKAQIAFMVRAQLKAGFESPERLDVGMCLPEDKKLAAQLVGHVVEFEDRGRYKVAYRREDAGGIAPSASPDRAHALMLANYAASQLAVLRGRGQVTASVRELNLVDGRSRGPAAQMMRDLGWEKR